MRCVGEGLSPLGVVGKAVVGEKMEEVWVGRGSGWRVSGVRGGGE